MSNISVAMLHSKQIGICSTGGDGCICCLEYDREREYLEFLGMKQVKELSLVRSVSSDDSSVDNLTSAKYAVGFASSDFIIWNLMTEAKVVQIPCGGWCRPYSYHLGDIPEMRNCFAYSRHDTVVKGWMKSKLLGEHVGGSAVRSICSVLKMSINNPRVNKIPFGCDIPNLTPDYRKHPLLLISVGTKRVLTSWQLRNKRLEENECEASSMSFQWLSTDTPTKSLSTHKKLENGERLVGKDASASNVRTGGKCRPHVTGKEETELKSCNGDKYKDDWRCMSVAAFLVKCAGSR